jgi:restriction endonuclease S subunit
MFELLKQGGKCAVVVSEGFHTWDQFSAKALRKMLLEEAQLKAVISLPQGLFVSKSGQGPKTSILLFEKGGSTDWVWFYKVINDGYTMGTNRREQKGNQLVECLTLYHNYVKHGKQPPETKNQFCIPAIWIKALDPRIKKKIRGETRKDMESKGKLERAKKEADLDKKIFAKKVTEADKQMELKLFDQMFESRIQNEIAKRIDKAHYYSFNLANYKSTISDSQKVEWTDALKHIQPNGAATLDEAYKKLYTNKPGNGLQYLVKLNPENALEADIAREYVNNLEERFLKEHEELYTIKEILKSGAKYPIVKLNDYLILNENKTKPSKNSTVNYKVLGVSNETGVFLKESLIPEETNQSYFLVEKNQFCYNPYRINVGSIGLNTFDYDNQIISGAYIVFGCKEDELNPNYLNVLFKSKQFLDYVNDKANGGVRMNFKFEDMAAWEIPLPSIEEQAGIAVKIKRQKAIIEGINTILENCSLDLSVLDFPLQPLSEICDNWDDKRKPISENERVKGNIPYYGASGIIDYVNDFSIEEDVLLVSEDGANLKARVYPIAFSVSGKCWVNNHAHILKFNNYHTQKFVEYYLNSINVEHFLTGSTMPKLNQANLNKIPIPIPDFETQVQIVTQLDSKIKVMESLKKMKMEAISQIQKIVSGVWGADTQLTKEVGK